MSASVARPTALDRTGPDGTSRREPVGAALIELGYASSARPEDRDEVLEVPVPEHDRLLLADRAPGARGQAARRPEPPDPGGRVRRETREAGRPAGRAADDRPLRPRRALADEHRPGEGPADPGARRAATRRCAGARDRRLLRLLLDPARIDLRARHPHHLDRDRRSSGAGLARERRARRALEPDHLPARPVDRRPEDPRGSLRPRLPRPLEGPLQAGPAGDRGARPDRPGLDRRRGQRRRRLRPARLPRLRAQLRPLRLREPRRDDRIHAAARRPSRSR